MSGLAASRPKQAGTSHRHLLAGHAEAVGYRVMQLQSIHYGLHLYMLKPFVEQVLMEVISLRRIMLHVLAGDSIVRCIEVNSFKNRGRSHRFPQEW